MSNKFTRAIQSFINKDTIFSIINNIMGLVRGPIMMLLIPLYISEEVQGYWYTITSLSMLSTFADLGFGTLVSQFSAHEFSCLSFDNNQKIRGEQDKLFKIASLFRYVIKWASCVCLIAYPLVMLVGVVVLNTHGAMAVWLLPWLIYMITGGLTFIARIVMSFFEGCGQIYKNQLNCAVSTLISCIIQALLLVGGAGLYSLALTSVISLVSNIIVLWVMYRKPIVQMYKTRNKVNYFWGKNFLRLIWKYALSWAGGYFIFQIYTPLAYITYDPVLAGKVGITITLISACYNLSYVFTGVLTPKVNMAIATRDYTKAKRQLIKGSIFSLAIYALGSIIILLLIGVVKGRWEFADKILNRFLNIDAVTIMLFAWLLQIPVNAIATYGRAHKQEPFLIPSLVSAVFVFGSTFIIIYTLPIAYLFMGFAVNNLITTIVFALMYWKLKDKWAKKLEEHQDKEHNLLQKQISMADINENLSNDNPDNNHSYDNKNETRDDNENIDNNK